MIKNIDRCYLMNLPKILDARGALTVVEGMKDIPFAIKRIYYSYNVPDNELTRGEHGHKNLQQVIIAMSGSFTVHLDDGFSQKRFNLNQPWQGLYVTSAMWRSVENFSHGALCMVMASEVYDAEDYIRNYDAFVQYVKKTKRE